MTRHLTLLYFEAGVTFDNSFLKFFFGVPHLATFILFLFNEYVIASIAYIHPVYDGIRTHVLLDMSRESSALTTRPRLIATFDNSFFDN